MTNPPFETLSKLEAATRQLRQAIRLFLGGGDIMAIHTLAAAALQVLADLGSKAGYTSALKNPQLIRADKRKFVADLFNAAQNFFKHADRDPEEALDFYPETTCFYIAEAVQLHRQLTGTDLPAWKAFNVWFSLNYPGVLVESPFRTAAEQALACDPSLSEKAVSYVLLCKLESE